MTATVYDFPKTQTQNDTNRPSGYTGPMIAANQKCHRTVTAEPNPTLARPTQGNDWPPFGGDAA
ncbi:hypothetical protein P3339_18835 [Microbulbifer sp. MLAF003]|uniref:hypothetical protein n=1 Tax=unclassified Microbulbifer TaxID=2619833 RepID=UPI0024AE33F5|nr:hypothetical protein [Microbulbifer sp. MLAF003]WHI50473.1 hypothetical protein P3339_18835 [Microbulbifer sp. MLAF003]